MRKGKHQKDQRALTDEQKMALKLQKLLPRGVLFGSKNMQEVERMMSKIYTDQDRKVVKYLSDYPKDETTLSKPLYLSVMDIIKSKKEDPLQKGVQQTLVDSPLIEEVFNSQNEFQRKKDLYADLFPKTTTAVKQEKQLFKKLQLSPESTFAITDRSKKRGDKTASILSRLRTRRNLTIPELGDQIFVTDSMKKINSPPGATVVQAKVVNIDNEDKLKKFEQDQQQINTKLIKKLGIMNEWDKKLLEIQELQARALKMRIKVSKDPLFRFQQIYQIGNNKTITVPGSRAGSRPATRSSQPSSTSPQGAQRYALRLQSQFLDRVIEGPSEYPENSQRRQNRPQTQRTKRTIMNFCDSLVTLQDEHKQVLQKDQEEVVGTLETIKIELMQLQSNLMDRNDELDKGITEQIKDQVLQYKNESNQRIIRK